MEHNGSIRKSVATGQAVYVSQKKFERPNDMQIGVVQLLSAIPQKSF